MIAFITGSGFYEQAELAPQLAQTPFGRADFFAGNLGGREILLLPRHGAGHRNLPNHINHRANLIALKEAGATAVVSLTVCGALDPGLQLGAPLAASDLYFPENRLPDGETCTVFAAAGASDRGHLLAASLIHPQLADAIDTIAREHAGMPAQPGTYGHVNGPRFNTQAEIAALQQAGVGFISQTCGPEAVLANELELPFALAGFAVDYANGVAPTPTSIDELQANLGASKAYFERIVHELTEPDGGFGFTNFVYRFD